MTAPTNTASGVAGEVASTPSVGPGLLLCPFCGGKAVLRRGGPGNIYVSCTGCNVSTDDTSQERAVAAWNTRPANCHDDLVEALEGLVYETTHLSPMEVDGSHWCRITADALEKARTALARARSELAR